MITSDQQTINMTTNEIGKLLNRFRRSTATVRPRRDLGAADRGLQARRAARVRGPKTAVARAVSQRSAADRVTRVRRRRHPHARLRGFCDRDRQAYPDRHLCGQPGRRSVPCDRGRGRARRELVPGRSSLQPDRGRWPPTIGPPRVERLSDRYAHLALKRNRPGLAADILALLTEPEAITRWAPVPFEVLALDRDRLRSGSHARVAGHLAGRRVELDVAVLQASVDRLELVAEGPSRSACDTRCDRSARTVRLMPRSPSRAGPGIPRPRSGSLTTPRAAVRST
jgi:hypothetical protein